MSIGHMAIFANLHEDMSDADFFRNELRIAENAEKLGYDAIWCPEHHFNDYSISVDPLQILTWLGARTQKIKLGSAGIVLPWWTQPIRIAERISVLDAMTNGRFMIGFARGAARREFEAFGIPMAETRERFDEAAKMIIKALQTGYMEGEGPFFPQKRTEIRPRPSRGLQDRVYAVAMSPDSAEAIAALDTKLMQFVQSAPEKHLPNLEIFRREFKRQHNREAPATSLLNDFAFCSTDAAYAEDIAKKYLLKNILSIFDHYEFMGDHFDRTAGYKSHAAAAKTMRESGAEKVVADYIQHQSWGTPQQILDRLWKRREILGDFEWNAVASFGGLPYSEVEQSMAIMAEHVFPEFRSWSKSEVTAQ
jgi:alkanesulfonate monooxygenase SsuD/methylene tetrahydromethanopterin reductase-like flavin-dependent oxidoreductase (luciferase family)